MKQDIKHLRDNMFVISCAARTGSTMLVHMLRTNPRIICHGEVYAGDAIGALTVNYRIKRQDSELDSKLLGHYREAPELIFFKSMCMTYRVDWPLGLSLKTDELFHPSYATVAKRLGEDKDIKIIHLYRNDLVAQYISHQVVLNQNGLTLISKNETRPQLSEFGVELNHFRDYVADVFHREQSSLDFYSEHRGYCISYEDAVCESEPVLNAPQEFIGVPPARLKKGTKKIIEQELEDLVTNLAEVRELYTELEDRRPTKNNLEVL